MKRLVVATRNAGKLREIRAVLAPLNLEILSLDDFSEISDIVEDGATFRENAIKKAREVSLHTGERTVGDDSGLVVEALQGRPGVYSSRYAGEKATDEERCKKVLAEMAGVPEGRRQAAFVCVIAVAEPSGKTEVVEGECRGEIAFSLRGNYGFGYDPIFFLPEYGKTMAELPPEVKNRISHRGRASEKLKEVLKNL